MRQVRKLNALGPCANIFNSANTGSWRLERPSVNFELCVKCGLCAMYCPPQVITIRKDCRDCVRIDWNYCKGCGICANECPSRCISMVDEKEAAANATL